MANAIAMLKLPRELTDGFSQAIRNTDSDTLETDLLRKLAKICDLGKSVHCIGVNKNRADLKTVTINRAINRLIGLHVDNWDNLELHSLHLSTNRICINVGNSDRYFLFVPISLMDMAGLLAEDIGPHWQAPRRHTDLGRQFLARFPQVPTVRCRLAPGEAYIAPTENLMHDGSSLGQTETDKQYTIRGHIRPV